MVDGQIISDPTTTLKVQKAFYEELYTLPPNVDSCTIPVTEIQEIVMLSDDERELCEGLLSIKECGNALQQLKNGKSPGTVAFTIEFYKKKLEGYYLGRKKLCT